MNNVRIVDDLDDELGDLLRAARDETALTTEAQKAAVWSAIGTSTLTAAATGTLKSSALKTVAAKWITVCIISLSATVGIVRTAIPRDEVEAVHSFAKSVGSLARPLLRERPAFATQQYKAVDPPQTGTSRQAQAAQHVRKFSTSPESLDAEAKLLANANAQLERGNAAEARRQLETYGKRFPTGRLSLERDVLEIEARKKLHENVADSVDAFKRAHPESPHASRLSN